MELRRIAHGDRSFTWTPDHVMTLSSPVVSHLGELIKAWAAAVPKEPTYVNSRWNVPTLIARFDGVVGENETFYPYEIESAPIGIGYASVMSSMFKERLVSFQSERWPLFACLTDDLGHHDDALWVRQVSRKEADASDIPLLIRGGNLGSGEFREANESLLHRSITTLWYRHSKKYGERLGWWKTVSAADAGSFPWGTSFVVKPIVGKHGRDVLYWGTGLKGKSTRSQILSTLERYGSMYLQPFADPMQLDLGGQPYNVFLRPYFAFDPLAKKWYPLGGMWVGRPAPNLRLHWASDSISGPLNL